MMAKKTKKALMSQALTTNLKYKKNTKLLNQAGSPVPPKQQGIQLNIAKTARAGKSRRISYTKKDGNFKMYDIQRYSFRENKGIIYFYGWDLKDKSIKSFLANGISNATQLNISHKRYWVVEMGNDQQQVDYWTKQRQKSKEQIAVQKINQQVIDQTENVRVDVEQHVQDYYEQSAQDMQLRKQMAMSDMDSQQRLQDQNGASIERQSIQVNDQVEPIIRTISRNIEKINSKQDQDFSKKSNNFRIV